MKSRYNIKEHINISDAEINDTKDFQSIIGKHEIQSMQIRTINAYRKKLWVLTAVSALFMVFFMASMSSQVVNEVEKDGQVESTFEDMIEVTDSELAPDLSQPDKMVEKENTPGKKNMPEVNHKKQISDADQGKLEERNATTEGPQYDFIEAMPVEGLPALYQYFDKELAYPIEALSDSIQGTVVVIFTINTEGRPEGISINNSLGEIFDHEAVRLIENMPPWKPATINGKPIDSKISIPLQFRIE